MSETVLPSETGVEPELLPTQTPQCVTGPVDSAEQLPRKNGAIDLQALADRPGFGVARETVRRELDPLFGCDGREPLAWDVIALWHECGCPQPSACCPSEGARFRVVAPTAAAAQREAARQLRSGQGAVVPIARIDWDVRAAGGHASVEPSLLPPAAG